MKELTDGRRESRQKGKEKGLHWAVTLATTPCWEQTLATVLSGALGAKQTRKSGVLVIYTRIYSSRC